MKALVAGHFVLDTVISEGYVAETLGGPPAYMGFLLRRLGFDVFVATAIGYDFGDDRLQQVIRSGIRFLQPPFSESPTTRFEITVLWGHRAMRLLSRCGRIPPPAMGQGEFDVAMVNPVAGEIAPESIPRYKSVSKFLYLDPQGFLRAFEGGEVRLSDNPKLRYMLRAVDAVKVDLEEGLALTATDDPIGIGHGLSRMGVREVLVTAGSEGVYLRSGERLYFLRPPDVAAFDGIGAGDLLGAGYCASRASRGLEESMAYAVACSTCRLDQPGLQKIPDLRAIEDEAAALRKKVEVLEGPR